MPAFAARPLAKAQRTRAAILAAAERLFARRGYAATRLEDVAEAMGLKRAALFYHFRDKQALYDAAIEDAFGTLVARLDAAFSAPTPIATRIERAVDAWADAIAERPTLARLILRHAAEAEALAPEQVAAHERDALRTVHEMRVALELLLDRLPELRFDPEGKDPHIRGQVFRSPTSLPVLFGTSSH